MKGLLKVTFFLVVRIAIGCLEVGGFGILSYGRAPLNGTEDSSAQDILLFVSLLRLQFADQ
jgi:hypothetical protein